MKKIGTIAIMILASTSAFAGDKTAIEEVLSDLISAQGSRCGSPKVVTVAGAVKDDGDSITIFMVDDAMVVVSSVRKGITAASVRGRANIIKLAELFENPIASSEVGPYLKAARSASASGYLPSEIVPDWYRMHFEMSPGSIETLWNGTSVEVVLEGVGNRDKAIIPVGAGVSRKIGTYIRSMVPPIGDIPNHSEMLASAHQDAFQHLALASALVKQDDTKGAEVELAEAKRICSLAGKKIEPGFSHALQMLENFRITDFKK